MTEHEALQQIKAIADAALGSIPTPPPEPVPPQPPVPLPPTPPPGVSGELVPGKPTFLQTGPSAWSVSNRSTNFGVSLSGGIAPSTLRVIDPNGNVAQLLASWGGGPAERTFNVGAGEIFIQVSIPGTYIVEVNVSQAGEQDSLELRDSA